MIARASGFRMGVGRFSTPRKGVGVITMPDVGLDITRRVVFLWVLVCYDCLYPVWRLEY
jgi:hypothetical protein